MINVVGNDLKRSGVKIGWFQENHIFDEHGEKVGYYEHNDIYDHAGRKIGYTENDLLVTMDGRKFRLDDIRGHVSGGSISDLARAAILLLIGD